MRLRPTSPPWRLTDAATPARPRTADWWLAVSASVVLVAYGNLSTLATWAPSPWPLVPLVGHPLLLIAALLWGRGPAGLSWAALGLARGGWARGLLPGLGLAALMAAIVGALILLFRAIGWSSATAYPAPAGGDALLLLGVRLLLLTALCEEVWFRGLLQALWGRLLGPWPGVLLTAGLFAAWHLTVWGWTLGQVTLQPALPLLLTYPVGLLAFFLGGLLFGWQRQVTGHLAGPIAAHWAIDAAFIALVLSGWL